MDIKLYCEDCGHVFDERDSGEAVYECSTDGLPQVGERRCQTCNKFCAKVADRSCPNCEAPDERLREATDEDIERFQQEQREAEERRRNPPPPSPVIEEVRLRQERRRAELREWWEAEGRAAFQGIGTSKAEGDGFGDLGERLERFCIESGSDILQLDLDELRELSARISR